MEYNLLPYLIMGGSLVLVPEITPTWLSDVIAGVVKIPHEDPSATLVEKLIAVYDRSESQGRSQFQKAVTSLLAATRPSWETYDTIYMLLQMVAYTKPINAPSVLEKLLRGRELIHLIPDVGTTLEALAVQAQAEYEVSDWLIDFLLRRIHEGSQLETVLTALEVFSLRDYAPLEIGFVILCRNNRIEIPGHVLLESCYTIVRRAGMKRVFAIFCGESLDLIANDLRDGGRQVIRAIAQAADAIGEKDPWFHALRAVVATLIGESVRPAIETLAANSQTAGDMLDDTIETVNQAAELIGENIVVTRIATSDYAQTLGDIPVEYLSIVDPGEVKVELINRVTEGDGSKLGREVRFAHESTMRISFDEMLRSRTEELAVE